MVLLLDNDETTSGKTIKPVIWFSIGIIGSVGSATVKLQKKPPDTSENWEDVFTFTDDIKQRAFPGGWEYRMTASTAGVKAYAEYLETITGPLIGDLRL